MPTHWTADWRNEHKCACGRPVYVLARMLCSRCYDKLQKAGLQIKVTPRTGQADAYNGKMFRRATVAQQNEMNDLRLQLIEHWEDPARMQALTERMLWLLEQRRISPRRQRRDTRDGDTIRLQVASMAAAKENKRTARAASAARATQSARAFVRAVLRRPGTQEGDAR